MDVFNGLSAADFLSDADTKISYSKEITKKAMAKSKIKPFIAKSTNDNTSIIKTHSKECAQGNIVSITLEDELIDSGATGNVTLNASSEELKEIKQFIKVDSYQHTVPSTGPISTDIKSKNFKSKAVSALTNWETRKFDRSFFHLMSADCTNMVVCGHPTDATPVNLVKADVLSTDDVSEAKRRAELGVDAEGNGVPPLVPIHTATNESLGYYEDVEYFVMLVGTNSARHIKNDPSWEAARKDALERGKTNPIFTGALGFWDGVLLLPSKTDSARNSGVVTSLTKFKGFGSVKKSDFTIYAGASKQETEVNLFLGAGACQLVVDHGVSYYDYPSTDDVRRMTCAVDRVFGMAKTKFSASANDGILEDSIFDGKDFGVIAVIASTGK